MPFFASTCIQAKNASKIKGFYSAKIKILLQREYSRCICLL